MSATNMTATDMSATDSPASPVQFEVRDGIALLTLNRPRVRNAIDDATRDELIAALARIERDASVRALVLTGAGPAFCAGGDLRGMSERLQAPPGQVAFNGWRRMQRVHATVSALHGLSKPTIAAVNGPASGLGCDLALCCDFIIASEAATFAMSYVLRGLIPDGGGMYFLPRRVGLARAKELIFSGRTVAAAEALSIGMIERVGATAALVTDALAWAAALSQGSAAALALSKSIMNESFEHSMDEVFARGSQAQAICYTTEEHRDAVAAFLRKTKPDA
jgi:enoyl-CoA hydratase/carnithine racemase